MTCICCGQCCRVIVLPAANTPGFYRAKMRDPRVRGDEAKDAAFIAAHWRLISAQRDRSQGDKVVALMYECDQIGDDNLCRRYGDRPPVCSGYPLYDGRVLPWKIGLHPGCGFATK